MTSTVNSDGISSGILGQSFDHADQQWASDWFDPAGIKPGPPAFRAPVAVRASHGVFSVQAWAELLYAVLDLAPSIFFFVVTVTLISVGTGLTIIYVGLPLLALGLLVARAGGHLQRTMAGVLLQLPVPGPARIRLRKPTPIGALTSVLADPGCWRAVTYHCVKILLAPITFAFAVGFYAAGLGALSYGLWQRYLPYQSASDGSRHRGAQWWPDYFIDTWPRMLLLAGCGALILLAAPATVRFFTTIDRILIASLLGRRPAQIER